MNGSMVNLKTSDVLHIPGLGFDGLVGYSPIAKELEMSPDSVKSYCRRNKLNYEELKKNDGESSCEQF